MKMDKSLLKKLVALAGALVFAALAGVDFYDHRHSKETVVASDALTETHMLSEWLPNLEGTYGDTPVFFFDSGVEGGTVLYVGGMSRRRAFPLTRCWRTSTCRRAA